jgi:transcriptional regulator with XRE-family HTH domain
MPESVVIDGTRYIAERPQRLDRRPLAALVAEARAANGQSLEQAARAIGSTKSHMLAIERGTAPRLPMLQKLLRHYGILFDEIADA